MSACKASKNEPATSTPPTVDRRPVVAVDAPLPRKGCKAAAFADDIPISEASGAVVVASSAGSAHLLVVGDSGTRGSFNEVSLSDGKVLRTGSLPLDSGASDDLEGLTLIGETYYAITSSGWLRHYRRDSNGAYRQTQKAYPVADRNRFPGLTCNPKGVNCGKNYEGLCAVRNATNLAKGACVGFAASKANGTLYCLTMTKRGRLRIDRSRTIRVSDGQRLTGCHFSSDGALLYAGLNLFGRSEVVRIRDWATPTTAKIESLGSLGSGFPEALAVAGRATIYRFSDMGGKPSLVDKYNCD